MTMLPADLAESLLMMMPLVLAGVAFTYEPEIFTSTQFFCVVSGYVGTLLIIYPDIAKH